MDAVSSFPLAERANFTISDLAAEFGITARALRFYEDEGLIAPRREKALAMRPGRPLMHGRLGPTHVLGLPGNPVSSYVCAFLFLVPLIRRMSGRSDLSARVESALLGCDLAANDERADYLRAPLMEGTEGLVATPFPVQDSSMMAPLAKADCLLIREPYAPAALGGSRCRIVKFER